MLRLMLNKVVFVSLRLLISCYDVIILIDLITCGISDIGESARVRLMKTLQNMSYKWLYLGIFSMTGMDGDGRTIEVCREFMHERCKRSDEECRYAHPPPHVEVNTNGRVTCCVDSLRVNLHLNASATLLWNTSDYVSSVAFINP